jgi:hypothetical protein
MTIIWPSSSAGISLVGFLWIIIFLPHVSPRPFFHREAVPYYKVTIRVGLRRKLTIIIMGINGVMKQFVNSLI